MSSRPNKSHYNHPAKGLMAACSVFALAMPAFAQDAAAQDATAQQDAYAGQSEIVVIAQGREQQLTDVPLAVTAVSAEALQNTGANDIRQLSQVAPSLQVSSTGSEANGSARIRGIGTVGDNPGLESSVGVIIDGVYRSRSGIGLSELGEIDRVEVLRGPQGTLFGRNTSAGLINVISKKPEFDFGGMVELTYGNYDYWRLQAAINAPLSETIAARVDGVYSKRDGFLNDVNNGTDLNTRDRYFVRGQLLFEPSTDLSVRLVGDYTSRDEECCGGAYIDQPTNASVGGLLDPAQNNIVRVLQGMGESPAAFSDPFGRDVYVTPGRSLAGKTKDWGVSMQVDYALGSVDLTSVTAYRSYNSNQGADGDYGTLDLLYRPAYGYERSFKTFSQELRLQGEAFDGKLDWLIGGYYANETLKLNDNLQFGADYGRFATGRIVTGVPTLAPAYFPANPDNTSLVPGFFAGPGASIAAFQPGFQLLGSIGNVGNDDNYRQKSQNFAIFTHNIFAVTDTVDLTLGGRYTSEKKNLRADYQNNNTVCPTLRTFYGAAASNPGPAQALAQALIGLGCAINLSSDLNGLSYRDKIKEDEFTGTANLSWKATPDLLLYASYSYGYKAGGFNLDRAGFRNITTPGATELRFDSETVNAMELGAKWDLPGATLGLTVFQQDFENFQLNTFNGTSFIVQNINGCKDTLNTNGSCNNTTWGVRSRGIELEANLRPADDFTVNLGMTYADTKYNDRLVGSSDGSVALDPALRLLPGQNLSNAPKWVATGSVAYTPELTASGLTGLFYVDGRLSGDYNTGSDLFPQKEQDGFLVVNARMGVRGPDKKWALEFWAQNLFNKEYTQVVFNSPLQQGNGANFNSAQYPGGGQIFSGYLAEPRTYGMTARFRF